MTFSRCAVVLMLLVSACRQTPPTPGAPPTRRGPTVPAIAITVQTLLQPANRASTHEVIIAGTKARSTDEAERWRLYDLAARTVTFVDELNGTYRVEPIADVLERRRAALRRPVDRPVPVAEFQATGAEREILTLPATQVLIRLGGYERELWLARHPRIPDDLFAIIHGTAEPAARLGTIAAEADEQLLELRGFPLLDRGTLPYGNATMVVERRVTAIRQREVPAALVEVPDGFRDVKELDANRPRASSRPRGQTAPGAGSPPSSTNRTSP